MVTDIDNFDAMMDEEKEEVYIFKHYEDAVAYLMCYGIRELSTGFPFNIKIEKLQ
jgi:sRNA-binding regulator protein Hfq